MLWYNLEKKFTIKFLKKTSKSLQLEKEAYQKKVGQSFPSYFSEKIQQMIILKLI